MKYRIRQANLSVELYCLPSTVFESSFDGLLAIHSFEEDAKRAYRQLFYPEWQEKLTKYTDESYLSHVETVRFHLPAALDRQRFQTFLGALFPSHVIQLSDFNAVQPITPLSPHKESSTPKLKGLRLAQVGKQTSKQT